MPLPRIELRVREARGHLTFFRKMVRKPTERIEAGALVAVYDPEGTFVGRGFYNPRSQVAVRILDASETTSEDFLTNRLRSAVDFRHKCLRLPEMTDAYRLCHAEGDGLSGLVIDRFGPVLAVQLYSRGYFLLLGELRATLADLFPHTKVHLRADEEIQRLEGFRLPDETPPEGVVVKEHDLQFRIDFARGHKTGFFVDQRENRRRLRDFVPEKDVLDLCTYTGGFALHAFRGGARKIVGVDMDEDALETARQNARLNRAKVDFLHADLFNYLRQTKDRFDVIVLDPPKMARDRAELPRARLAYRDMNILALKVIRQNGLLVSCSCSGLVGEEEFLEILRDASHAANREISSFIITGAGPDHPISSLYPEGRYLKVVFSRVP